MKEGPTMIIPLSLQEHDIVEQLWLMQHRAYRMEALAVGLTEYPPLPDTFESIRNSGEQFYGYYSVDEDLIGAVAVTSIGSDHLEITRLMVDPFHLRQGIGKSLLAYVLALYSEMSAIIVSAGSRNDAAVSLYEKYGFTPYYTVIMQPGVELTRFQFVR